jgi:hypothetical protein
MALYTKSKEPSPRNRDLNVVMIRPSEEARGDVLENEFLAAIAYTTEEGQIKYIYAPKLVIDAEGKYQKIIGNASNKMDEFRPIALSCHAMKFASHISRGSKIHADAPKGIAKLTAPQLAGTAWESSSHEYFHHFISVIGTVPYGVVPVLGRTSDMAVQEAFTSYGDGGKFWIEAIDAAIASAADITTVEHALGTDPSAQLSTLYPAKIATYHGSPTITIETLDAEANKDYVDTIRKAFGYKATTAPVAPTLGVVGPAVGAPQAVLMRTENVEDTTDSAAAFIRMQIMSISAVLDDEGKLSNLKLPVATAAYDTVRAKKSKDERGASLVRVWRSKIAREGKKDPLNVLISKRSMYMIGHHLGLSLVHAKWTDAPCDEESDENRVSIHAFLPQSINSQAAKSLRAYELNRSTQDLVNEDKSKRDKKRTSLAQLGDIRSMDDVVSCIANWCSFEQALWSCVDGEQPLHYQLFLKVVNFILEPTVSTWAKKHEHAMPHLCFAYMQLLDLICVQFARAANDFFIIDKISGGDIPGIELESFQEITSSVFDFMGDIRKCIRTNSPLVTVPGCTPLEFRPDYAKKQRLQDILPQPALPPLRRQTPPFQPVQQYQQHPQPPPHLSAFDRRGGRGQGGRDGGRGGGRDGGRGGRGNAGRHGRGGGIPRATDYGKVKGCIHVDARVPFTWPAGMEKQYCEDWMCVDRFCPHPYGECNKIHTQFNNLSKPDKVKMGEHARNTKGFWFDAKINMKDLADSFRDMMGTALGRGKTY